MFGLLICHCHFSVVYEKYRYKLNSKNSKEIRRTFHCPVEYEW